MKVSGPIGAVLSVRWRTESLAATVPTAMCTLPCVRAVFAGRRSDRPSRGEGHGSASLDAASNGGLSTISASELSAPPALSDPAIAPVLSLVQATDVQWERARRREAVIAELANASDLANQVTRTSAGLGVSRRTVFRWLAAYRDAPQTSSLLARSRGTPTGARRIDTRLEQLIAEVIRDVYLTKVRAK